ncbi:putative membrane protein [Mycobacteroides abscessus 21]|uniref:Putative membrane protein n=1 Tax=Mycobacteroides abscessus 21 TaxID=1299324 RepID=A0A829Q0Z7_9MYCO|nr:putative membrane protein [Mycobacteroides abscessus 21]
MLTAVGVWGLHVLTRGDGVAGVAGWVILLCLAFSALGKGIGLLRRALAPVSAVLSASVAPIPAPARAVTGIGVGAAGLWWVLRGHAATWWAQLTGTDMTGTDTAWSLPSQLAQVAIVAVAAVLLFGGAKVLGQLIFANSGTRQQHSLGNNSARDRWSTWWSSHAGLGLSLLAGAAALVLLSGYVVPRVSGWLTGDDPMAALAAIAAILSVAFLANTWWWRALSGWWTWAHTPNGPGGATPIGQIYAGAGVLALVAFSATAFGLATFSSYLPQTAAVASADPCGPDGCGGGGNGQGSYGPDTGNFQPPQMPNQMPDYQGGINQPPLDQNSGISIYNENPSAGQVPSQTGGQQSVQDPSFRANPDGSWQARNGEWSPPNYQTATPGLTQGPGQPNPGWSGNQAPQINTPQQPIQQAPQAPQPAQQAPQAPQQPAQAPQNPAGQQPVEQAPQQPAQQNLPQTGQNQTGQTQPGQQPQKEPEAPKKNPMDPTDLASAATRRGSQQAGEQAGQQAVQQGTQQATQQAPKSTAQTQQAPQSTQQGQQTPKPAQQSQQAPQQTKPTNGKPQAPQQTKPTNGKPKGIDGAAKGAPEEQPWDITGEIKPIHEQFPNGSQKVGMQGRLGIQNKDPISIGQTTVGQYDLGSSFQQKLGGELEASSMVNPPGSGSNTLVPKAEAFAGYNLENKSFIYGPGMQGTITNTLKVGPSLSKGATTGTPIGASTVFQNLGDGKFFINLPVSVPYKAVEVGSTIQGVVDVPQLIQGTLGQAGQWITSGIPSVFGG